MLVLKRIYFVLWVAGLHFSNTLKRKFRFFLRLKQLFERIRARFFLVSDPSLRLAFNFWGDSYFGWWDNLIWNKSTRSLFDSFGLRRIFLDRWNPCFCLCFLNLFRKKFYSVVLGGFGFFFCSQIIFGFFGFLSNDCEALKVNNFRRKPIFLYVRAHIRLMI